MSIPPTLLLADDSLTIQRVVSLTFADQAIRVVVAKDGQDAINRMAAHRPDLVLADTNLPCVDGYELARAVRASAGGASARLIALTGYGQPDDRRRSAEAGFDAHLVKPVSATALLGLL